MNGFHNQLQHEKFQYDSKTINQLRLAMRVKGSKDKDGASYGVVQSGRIIAHKMSGVIGVSDAQLKFVTNSSAGMGIIKCGSVVVPFDNTIEKSSDLYRLYNTNIHEKIEKASRNRESK